MLLYNRNKEIRCNKLKSLGDGQLKLKTEVKSLASYNATGVSVSENLRLLKLRTLTKGETIMKRSELTTAIMRDRGFYPVDSDNYRLKDIVFNIQENEYWKYLRCRVDKSSRYSHTLYQMCATYEVYTHKEYLEYSSDKITWYPVAYRFVEYGRRCVYAD